VADANDSLAGMKSLWVVLPVFTMLTIVCLTIAGFWLVWQNRASGKILEGVIPIYVASLIGIVLTTGLAKIEPTKAEIPVGFIYNSTSRIPVFLPQRHNPISMEFLPGKVPESERMKVSESSFFHHILQAAIVDELGTYFRGTWLPSITRVQIGGGGTTRTEGGDLPKGVSLDTKALDAKMAGNRLAGEHLMPPILVLPPGTEMDVTVPNDDSFNAGEITFRKRGFFDLTIKTTHGETLAGLGPYSLFFPEESIDLQNKYRSTNFMITVTANFRGYRSGHPDMQSYRDWADKVIDVLKNGFDAGEAYARTKDAIVLRKQLGK
jgi:hypothetical protein